MKSKYYLLALGLVLLGAAACKKKTTNNNTTGGNIDITGKSKQEVFMMQKWKVGAWVDSSELFPNQDVLDQCQKDDSYSFFSTSAYTLDRGTCKNSGELQTENLAWSMPSANSTSVTIWGLTFTIVSQTSTTITIQRTYTDGGGYPTKETVTFGKY
jgi:hypothetical protein